MISLDTPALSVDSEYLNLARHALAGKRVALIGFPPQPGMEITRVIQDADGFTRSFSPSQMPPGSEALKTYELILINVEAAVGTAWLDGTELSPVTERSIAVGNLPALLRLTAVRSAHYREYWTYADPAEDLLLRCALGLRGEVASRNGQASCDSSTVVLADDDPSVTGIVRRAFERNGLVCELASTGGEALKLIAKLKPCAAILDVNMPDIDGFEVLSRMKSVPEQASTKVILLTGCERESDVIRGFSLGADDYVCKPFNPMELTIRLMRALGRI